MLKQLLEIVPKAGLTPNEYVFLLSVAAGRFKEKYFSGLVSVDQVRSLAERGFVKITSNNKIILRAKFTNLANVRLSDDYESMETSDVSSWIEEWRKLWPSGVRSGNRLVKGDKQGCLKKMQWFVKNHPTVSKEQIFKATESYLEEMEDQAYYMTICADYFIQKEGASQLASRVEMLEEVDEDNNAGGNDPFTIQL